MGVGSSVERGGGTVCLIKYKIENKNQIHDLRVIIGRGLDNFEDPIVPDGSQYLKPISIISSLVVALTILFG